MICVLVIGGGLALAQDKPILGESIPKCTLDDINGMKPIITEVSDRMSGVSDSLSGATEADIPWILADMNSLQVDWWESYRLEIPYCTMGVLVSETYGHMLDEMLFMMVFFQLGDDNAMQQHQAALGQATDDMVELSAQMEDYTDRLTS